MASEQLVGIYNDDAPYARSQALGWLHIGNHIGARFSQGEPAMSLEQQQDYRLIRQPVIKEDKVDPMWAADEDERRAAIIRRAAAGARKTLRSRA